MPRDVIRIELDCWSFSHAAPPASSLQGRNAAVDHDLAAATKRSQPPPPRGRFPRYRILASEPLFLKAAASPAVGPCLCPEHPRSSHRVRKNGARRQPSDSGWAARLEPFQTHQPSKPRTSAAVPTAGGRFITTKPDRSRCSTSLFTSAPAVRFAQEADIPRLA